MKVYLSKSNTCNPLDYMLLNTLLENYKDLQLRQFNGGNYDHQAITKLITSDRLLILPPKTNFKRVGKGQYEQITSFRRHNPGVPVYFVCSTTEELKQGSIFIQKIKNEKVIEENWKTDWADLDLYVSHDFFENMFEEFQQKEVNKDGDYKLNEEGLPILSTKLHLACINLFK